jgi:hypothetical protein
MMRPPASGGVGEGGCDTVWAAAVLAASAVRRAKERSRCVLPCNVCHFYHPTNPYWALPKQVSVCSLCLCPCLCLRLAREPMHHRGTAAHTVYTALMLQSCPSARLRTYAPVASWHRLCLWGRSVQPPAVWRLLRSLCCYSDSASSLPDRRRRRQQQASRAAPLALLVQTGRETQAAATEQTQDAVSNRAPSKTLNFSPMLSDVSFAAFAAGFAFAFVFDFDLAPPFFCLGSRPLIFSCRRKPTHASVAA